MRDHPAPGEKAVFWVGSAKRDLLEFPEPVMSKIGTALSVAQFDGKHPATKPWHGSGPGIMEVVADHDRSTYRAVYTIRFEQAVYVLHCFQKKSPRGISTARPDIDLINRRLKAARDDYEARYGAS